MSARSCTSRRRSGSGVAVGAATGFVGPGGGFAIVPALVLVAGLPMPAAVGTSLLVITMQSAAGLAGHLSGASLPWGITLAVTASAVPGSLAVSRFTGRIHAETLRRGFGIGVLVVAVFVLAEQLPHATLMRVGPGRPPPEPPHSSPPRWSATTATHALEPFRNIPPGVYG